MNGINAPDDQKECFIIEALTYFSQRTCLSALATIECATRGLTGSCDGFICEVQPDENGFIVL